MSTITLKELNDSYQSLLSVGESVTSGKIKYRLARVIKSAKDEIELMAKILAGIAERHGATMLGGGKFQFDSNQVDQAAKFNQEAEDFLKSETVELWGDPKFFQFDELEKAESPDKRINAADLSNLLWLFTDTD